VLRCGGAIGVYFLVKRCMLLYVYSNNGTFSPPPYLDAHGEVDISMRCVCFSVDQLIVN
jgi:E3 ubiquitin-protein ligase UBR1